MLEITYTKILNSPAKKMRRLFNYIPGYLRDITGYTTEYFKKQLNDWLKEEVPDYPKCGIYAGRFVGVNNSIGLQYSVSNSARN